MTTNREWLYGMDVADLAEWFDAEHEDPCTSEGENVQGLPDDNVLYLLRDVAKKCDGHTLYHGVTKLMQTIGKEPEGRCETGRELAVAFNTLADMVERDYVSREFFDAMRDECQRLEGERDDALEIRDKACGDAATFKAERDELKAKLADLNAEYYDAACAKDAEIRRLEAERDEWKDKAEGSGKVRVGSSSAKRAAAVERIKHRAAYENWLAVILGIDERSSEWENIRADEVGQHLIDLLSDDELPVPSSSPNGTANGTANGTCPDGDGTASNDSREKLEAELDSIISDALRNLRRAIYQCVEQRMDVLSFSDGEFIDFEHEEFVGEYVERAMKVLDRQAAITERECREYEDALREQHHKRIAELQAKLDDAEFERDKLRDRLEDDWKYANLKKQVDMLRGMVAELKAGNAALLAAHADDVERLDAMREGELMAQNEKLREKVKNQTRQLAEVQDALERRNQGELKKRWQKQVDELQGELDYCRKRYEERTEHDQMERDYWREQVRLCLDSAYPPNHSPERSYDPNVMACPDRHGCTTPSSLVSAVIDGLRDERSAQYMSLVKELMDTQAENEKLKAEVIQYAKDCGECGTAMPKGVIWPRFADGSLLRYGDLFLDGSGDSHECHCVEFIDPKTAGLGASTIIHGNRYGIGGEYDGISYNLFKGRTLERPTEDEGMA